MFAVQTVEIIVWVAFRGSFIKVTIPFNMDSYYTTLDTRDRLNIRVICRWTEVTGWSFMKARQVGQRSGMTTLYTQISMCPWSSFQLFLMMP